MAGGSDAPGPPQRAVPAAEPIATVGGYALLLLFGLLQGVTGSLQFSRGIGPVPLAAVGFALVIGFTCALCGWGMRSRWGAICPAAGWLIASIALAAPEKSGTVVITNTGAGQIYLYGGALCAAIGAGVGPSLLTRARARATPLPGPGSFRRDR